MIVTPARFRVLHLNSACGICVWTVLRGKSRVLFAFRHLEFTSRRLSFNMHVKPVMARKMLSLGPSSNHTETFADGFSIVLAE